MDKDAVVAESRGIAQATAVRSRMGTGVSVIFEDGPAQAGAESPSASAAWDEERRRHEEAVHVAAADREASIHPQMQVIFATLRPVSAGTGHLTWRRTRAGARADGEPSEADLAGAARPTAGGDRRAAGGAKANVPNQRRLPAGLTKRAALIQKSCTLVLTSPPLSSPPRPPLRPVPAPPRSPPCVAPAPGRGRYNQDYSG